MLFLAVSVPAALTAKDGTTTIPVVFIASDPSGSGLIPLVLPGRAGNLTGFSLPLCNAFSSKWPKRLSRGNSFEPGEPRKLSLRKLYCEVLLKNCGVTLALSGNI